MSPRSESSDLVLKVLVRREGDQWILHSLEHEFAAHGPTRDAALRALAGLILIRLRTNELNPDPLADVPAAPMEFWERWDSASHHEEPRRIISRSARHPGAFVSQAVVDSQPKR